jgi:thiamine biosynthesis lipoprotein
MSTDVAIRAPEATPRREWRLADAVVRQFASIETRFSRFRAESELSRLNASHGPVVVSTELFQAIERARGYWELTDGWFDFTIGRALRDAGYDRDFAPGVLDRTTPADKPARASVTSADIRLDRASRTIELPPGMLLDCGGFVKGWAVDEAIGCLPKVAAVDAGGDAFLSGAGLDRQGWRVYVEDPWHPGRPIVAFRARDTAVATSGANRRKWQIGGRAAHHLIDPRTAEPAVSDLVQVTVLAPRAELADVLAKTVFLRGRRDGARFLEGFADVAAVLVAANGDIQIEGLLEIETRAAGAREMFTARRT